LLSCVTDCCEVERCVLTIIKRIIIIIIFLPSVDMFPREFIIIIIIIVVVVVVVSNFT